MADGSPEQQGSTWRGRVEDAALLRGLGRYSDDVRQPRQAAAVFVRSPHGAARIVSLDAERARAAPGILAVLTGEDMAGLGNICQMRPFPGRAGVTVKVPHRPALAREQVRHIGEPVALVVAESEAAALDAAELIAIDYQPLPAVAHLHQAAEPDAPQLWPEAPGNLALDWVVPSDDGGANAREIERIFSGAAHIAHVELANQRIAVASLETRGATAVHDAASGSATLYCGTQGVSVVRDQLAAILSLPREKLRVVTQDVGGAFGMKTPAYPEYAALLVAARRFARPVHWMSSRAESFLSDNQARDTLTKASLALDRDGRFLALKVEALADMGAYLSPHGAFIATVNFGRCFPTVYHIPHLEVWVRCLFTNTLPTGPYRGAGRPEANYVMERLVEEAARVTGIDSVALRRRNLIGPERMPYRSPAGATYDGGQFEAVLDRALAVADRDGFAARRRNSEAAGMRRGFGISCFLEHAGGAPQEPAELAFLGDGTVRVGLATQASGQGHATIFRRLAAERLRIPVDRVAVWQGDTQIGLSGFATVASRSTMIAGSAVAEAAARVLTKGRQVAALALEAAEGDIEYRDGSFAVAGTDRRLSLFEVAERAKALHARNEIPEPLDTRVTTEIPQSYPNGCHIAEVEIDSETGAVTLVAYTAVDDCGTMLDPVMVEGQVHGAIAQGVGQALVEHARYDRDGQMVSGSFMDYAMPRADLLPMVTTAHHTVPCRTNPLGVKGVGEAGTTAALAAVMNAVIDAVPEAPDLEMPATAERIWRAIHRS